MSIQDIVEWAFAHRRFVIVLLLVLTAGFGVAATAVDETHTLEEFETDSEQADASDYIAEHFADGNTTTAQVIVEDENVLDRESMLATLSFQQTLRANETVNATLVEDDAVQGVANAIATAAYLDDHAAAFDEQAAELEARNESLTAEFEELSQAANSLEERSEDLNETAALLEGALDEVAENPEADPGERFEQVRQDAPVELTADHREAFETAAEDLRSALPDDEDGIEAAYQAGTTGVLAEEFDRIELQGEELDEQRAELEAEADELESEFETLEAEIEAFEASSPDPSLSEQRAALAALDDDEIESLISDVLDGENEELLGLLPAEYDPGETSAEATAFLLNQDTRGEYVSPDTAPEHVIDSQRAIDDLAPADGPEFVAFGNGITAHEVESSMDDSLAIVGPIALLFVLVTLSIAYRDPIDVALGLFGIFVVLVWTFGFMGLTGIDFGIIFIAVPVLLIGLSIDYAIHVFMRGREARTGTDRSVEAATKAGLTGVGFALVLVTVTMATGFLSNLVSPMPPIREFGLVNAVGIAAALVVFGLLVPLLKVEIDGTLEARGYDRHRPAFGVSGRLQSVLRTGGALADRVPLAIVLAALLVSGVGVAGATALDTEFSVDDFMAEDPPSWTEHAPGSLEPGEYVAAERMEYVDETFLRQELQSQLLFEGDPTDPAFLAAANDGEKLLGEANTTARLPNDEPAVRGPISTIESVAEQNETVNQTVAAADTTGDGLPDTDLEVVYDAVFAADEDAAADVFHREDGEYQAARVVAIADGEASHDDIANEVRKVADDVDETGVVVTETGEQTVLYQQVEEDLFDTVVESLVLTLVGVGLFLAAVTRRTAGSASLGIVTVVPVVMALAWTLGTMSLLGYAFHSVNAMITSLTIGLGVAYSIHISQRYHQQLSRGASVREALETTTTGTGGALLGSAATTAIGFGVLAFAFLPSLQQFGIITGTAIIYAFLAAVLVLPSLLVLWTRFLGPDVDTDDPAADAPSEDSSQPAPPVDPQPEDGAGITPSEPSPGGSAVRQVDPVVVTPGDTCEVTVRLDLPAGKSTLREQPPGAIRRVDIEPADSAGRRDPGEPVGGADPVDTVVGTDSLYVHWETNRPLKVSVSYTVAVPELATRTTLAFDGQVDGADCEVGGNEAIELVTDVREYLLTRTEVGSGELRSAGEKLQDGTLDEAEYRRVVETWLSTESEGATSQTAATVTEFDTSVEAADDD